MINLVNVSAFGFDNVRNEKATARRVLALPEKKVAELKIPTEGIEDIYNKPYFQYEETKLIKSAQRTANLVKVVAYFPLIGNVFGLARLISAVQTENLPNRWHHIVRASIEFLGLGFLLLIPDLYITKRMSKEEVQFPSPFLQKKEQIDQLKSINGLTIEKIEKRAKPGGYSGVGFIGPDEGFNEVLIKDWRTVELLKVTHAELADHLTNIGSLARHLRTGTIEYSPSYAPNNTIPTDKPQKLTVNLVNKLGWQNDLFTPESNLPREVNTPMQWDQAHEITNKANGVSVRINTGVLSYIREFGFYEGGGDDNPYRVDPAKVMAILTGKSLEDVRREGEARLLPSLIQDLFG